MLVDALNHQAPTSSALSLSHACNSQTTLPPLALCCAPQAAPAAGTPWNHGFLGDDWEVSRVPTIPRHRSAAHPAIPPQATSAQAQLAPPLAMWCHTYTCKAMQLMTGIQLRATVQASHPATFPPGEQHAACCLQDPCTRRRTKPLHRTHPATPPPRPPPIHQHLAAQHAVNPARPRAPCAHDLLQLALCQTKTPQGKDGAGTPWVCKTGKKQSPINVRLTQLLGACRAHWLIAT